MRQVYAKRKVIVHEIGYSVHVEVDGDIWSLERWQYGDIKASHVAESIPGPSEWLGPGSPSRLVQRHWRAGHRGSGHQAGLGWRGGWSGSEARVTSYLTFLASVKRQRRRQRLALENIEANATQPVDVWVVDLGEEADLGRGHGVVVGEEELELEYTACYVSQ